VDGLNSRLAIRAVTGNISIAVRTGFSRNEGGEWGCGTGVTPDSRFAAKS
jgi:anthranilate/para-aminobenzoate synthase component I